MKILLITTIKGNSPKITMTMVIYIDETDDAIIDKTGKKIEKFRVMEYLKDGGGRTENPDYDSVKVVEHDLPGYVMFSKNKKEE